jgi:hypothetical protein
VSHPEMTDADMTDSVELRELRTAFAALPAPERPPLETVTSRGREHRRRRRQGIFAAASVAAIAAGAVVAIGAAGSGGRGGSAVGRSSGRSPTVPLGTVRTAAYTIVSHPDGTATLTIALDRLLDPRTLQGDLARAGVPSLVTVGKICSSDPPPPGFSQVVSYDAGNSGGPDQPQGGQSATLTVDPAALPSGTELSVGDVPLPDAVYRGVRLVSVGLVDKASHTCSSAIPTSQPAGGARFVGIPPAAGSG